MCPESKFLNALYANRHAVISCREREKGQHLFFFPPPLWCFLFFFPHQRSAEPLINRCENCRMGLNKQEKEVMEEKRQRDGGEKQSGKESKSYSVACVVLQLPTCEKDSY